MNTGNQFEVLKREASAPHATVPEPDAKVQVVTIPDVQTPATPAHSETAAEPLKPDLSKAPGSVSYADKVKGEGSPKAAHKSKAGEPLVNEPNYQFVHRYDEEPKASEEDGKPITAEEQPAEENVPAGDKASKEVAPMAERVLDQAREYALAAKERMTEAGEVVKEHAQRGVEFLKESAPTLRVAQDTAVSSEADQASSNLLEEALAISGGHQPPISAPPKEDVPPSTLHNVPGTPSVTGTPELTPLKTSPEDAAPVRPPVTVERATQHARKTGARTKQMVHEASEKAHELAEATKDKVHGFAEDAKVKAHELSEAAKEKTHEAKDAVVEKTHKTKDAVVEKTHKTKEAAVEQTHSAGDAAAKLARDTAPDELVRRGDREALKEGEQPGTLGGLMGAVRGATDYVKEHLPGSPNGSSRPHEYRAWPGDIHVAQISKALRDKWHGTEESMKQKAHEASERFEKRREERLRPETDEQRAVRYATGESPSLGGMGEDAYQAAQAHHPRAEPIQARASETAEQARTKTAKVVDEVADSAQAGAEEVKSKTSAALDSVGSGYQTAKDRATEVAQAVGERARGAVDVVQGKLADAKNQLLTPNADLEPTTPDAVHKSHDEIPSDTQSILAAQSASPA